MVVLIDTLSISGRNSYFQHHGNKGGDTGGMRDEESKNRINMVTKGKGVSGTGPTSNNKYQSAIRCEE